RCVRSALLCPYTTLFRSICANFPCADMNWVVVKFGLKYLALLRLSRVGNTTLVHLPFFDFLHSSSHLLRRSPSSCRLAKDIGALDRKSTRLNSSHVSLSY